MPMRPWLVSSTRYTGSPAVLSSVKSGASSRSALSGPLECSQAPGGWTRSEHSRDVRYRNIRFIDYTPTDRRTRLPSGVRMLRRRNRGCVRPRSPRDGCRYLASDSAVDRPRRAGQRTRVDAETVGVLGSSPVGSRKRLAGSTSRWPLSRPSAGKLATTGRLRRCSGAFSRWRVRVRDDCRLAIADSSDGGVSRLTHTCRPYR